MGHACVGGLYSPELGLPCCQPDAVVAVGSGRRKGVGAGGDGEVGGGGGCDDAAGLHTIHDKGGPAALACPGRAGPVVCALVWVERGRRLGRRCCSAGNRHAVGGSRPLLLGAMCLCAVALLVPATPGTGERGPTAAFLRTVAPVLWRDPTLQTCMADTYNVHTECPGAARFAQPGYTLHPAVCDVAGRTAPPS